MFHVWMFPEPQLPKSEKPCVIRPAETPPAVEPPRSLQQLKRRGKASGGLEGGAFPSDSLSLYITANGNGTPTKKKWQYPRTVSEHVSKSSGSWTFLDVFFKLYMGETWWNWGWLSVIFFQRRRHHPAIGGPPDNSSESWHRRFTASRVVINGTLWESNTAMENPWKSTGNEGLMRV